MVAADHRLGDTATLAVVVTPGVSTYLERTLRGVAEQTVPAATVLVVDTSAPDGELGSGVPITDVITAVGLDDVSRTRVIRVPAARTFGAAVRAALREHHEHERSETRRAPDVPEPATPPWLWLLHDDSAPEPQTLAELVRTLETGPSIAVAGAKQRDWERPDLLLEVGVQATSTGRRVPDIESGEIDQGQHDSRQDVQAVGTAGALVRREVWDELGGPDPALGPFADGLELCRRAWLAGHRVVLAPGAVVHHARASFLGLRDLSSRRSDPDPATGPDPRRSFGARRRAQLFVWLVTVRWVWLPAVVLAILALAPLRALWRLATKELALVGAEMRAAAEVLARPGALWRARRRHRRSRRVPARYLRPLLASGWDVVRARRDERRSVVAARSRRRAPSELEIAERAALTRRRRGTFWVLLVALTAVALTAFGPWLTSGVLQGGALAAVEATAGDLWRAATSAWVSAGLGHPGPSDPFLALLALGALPLAPLGAGGSALTTAVLVLGVPLAGTGAWFAAGAASRSVLLRAWAAAVWALAPALLLATGQGRLGAVIAHLLLPWVALGLVRAVGVDRRDVIVSGMVGAQRVALPAVVEAESEEDLDDDEPVTDAEPAADDAGTESTDAEPAAPAVVSPAEAAVPSPAPVGGGSIAAAAGAGLALAAAGAAAPVLLPAGLVVLLVLAIVVPRRRRRLLLVALPPLLVLGPIVMTALSDLGAGSWRVLLAGPGRHYAVPPADGWLAALGWPQRLEVALPGLTGSPWSLLAAGAGGASLLLVAVLALLRGSGRARAVRGGWVAVVVGLLAAVAAGRTHVGTGADLDGGSQAAYGWAGPGISLALLGLLVAGVSGWDGLRAWLGSWSFGWRQVGAGLVTVLMVVGPALTTTAWLTTLLQDRGTPTDLSVVAGRETPPVPALATELQQGEEQARVLALHPEEAGVRAEVWRREGPQLVGTSSVVAARALTGAGQDTETVGADPAADELAAVVAELSAGTAQTAADRLGRFAVAVLLVPPTTSATDGDARQALVAQLDATAGLERVTENDSGTIWRVSRSADSGDAAAASVARVRVLDAEGTVLGDLPSREVTVTAQVPRGQEGRTVVLAERADPGWQATVNGRALRATSEGWRQAFVLPEYAGELVIDYEPSWQLPWRIVSAIGLVLVLLLALPVRRRREVTTP